MKPGIASTKENDICIWLIFVRSFMTRPAESSLAHCMQTKYTILYGPVKEIKITEVYFNNTFPAPLPFSPAVIVLSCKNGNEIIRRETADNRNDAILNQVRWEIGCEGLGYRTEGVGYKKFPEFAE